MELENRNSSQLASPSGTEFKDSNIFEEFTNYMLKLPPRVFGKLRTKFEHDITQDTADTNQRGPINYPEAENATSFPGSSNLDENEVIDESENFDDEEIIKLFTNTSLGLLYELFMKILTFPLTLFRGPAKVMYNPSKTYENIKATLVYFEDNGNFEKLDSYSKKMVGKYRKEGDFDIVAAVTIEQAQCALYRNDLRGAMRLAREAHELAGHTRFPPLFHAQAFLVMSSVSRNKHQLGETERYLDLAKQRFECGYSIEDLAHFHELYGSYLDQFLGTFAKLDEQVKELALTSFQKMSEIGSQDSRQRVSDKKRFYAMVRSARIHLDSNFSFGRKERTVTKNSIEIAAGIVRDIKRDLLNSIPRGSKIQFQLVESDLYYRQGRFGDAIELLHQSFDEAKLFGFETEGPKITQRIQEIQQLLDHEKIADVVDENFVEKESSTSSYDRLIDSETSQNENDVFSSQYMSNS